MKKTFSSLVVLGLLGAGIQVSAQQDESPVQIDASVKARSDASLPKLPIRADIKMNREGIKSEVEMKRASTSEKKDERKEALESSKEMKKEVRASTTIARKDEHRKKMERNINFHGELMMKRFNAAVERFEKIIIRIDSRIEKIQAEGKVTTEAEKFEADAKVSIESAKVSIAKIPDVLVEALAQEKLGGSFEDLRTLAASIRADLLSAQKSLLNAVASLKKLSAEAEIESTTSVDTSVQ